MTVVSDMSGTQMDAHDRPHRNKGATVVLGEDWDKPAGAVEQELASARTRRGLLSLKSSPLARKIILFNLLAILVLVSGVLFLNPARDSLLVQRERGLVIESQLIADAFELSLQNSGVETPNFTQVLDLITLPKGVEIRVFDNNGDLIAQARGNTEDISNVRGLTEVHDQTTSITNVLNWIWSKIAGLRNNTDTIFRAVGNDEIAFAMVDEINAGETLVRAQQSDHGAVYTVVTPIQQDDITIALIAVTSAAGEIDALVRTEREQVLQMFVIALVVSIFLSLVLASTIANPLSDLSAAAELGRDKHARKMSPQRVRIPDLTARPDEIGRLSSALRGMVAALYDRIDSNEQFAADVAHEIKNPLASLRSAVGTLRVAKTDDQRTRLLDVIDHDVRRLDRLVSDISNASRLDSELVKEDEEAFDLINMLKNIGTYHAQEAQALGIDYISDLPAEPVEIFGLEARLAQVFVNLVSNALSFCEEGDAIRMWARKRENRVLVVVEDTGPGIPEQALTKVFNRFYSERPEKQFGNHSGLGLAISKQIVEAHGGVIWAENIRPTDADITSSPLGARFVVGLPV